MFTKRSGAEAARHAMRCLFAVVVAVSAVAAPSGYAAEKLLAVDRTAIEQTIRRQLDAFTRDDADGAFGYATPDIRRMFGSPDSFLQMVRDHYEPVYRAASVAFVVLEFVDGQWVQGVQIVDGEGKVWRALFTMKRQPDKTWKVGGCQLAQTRAIAT